MDLADVQQLVGTSAKTTERYAAVAPQKGLLAANVLATAVAKARAAVEKRQADLPTSVAELNCADKSA